MDNQGIKGVPLPCPSTWAGEGEEGGDRRIFFKKASSGRKGGRDPLLSMSNNGKGGFRLYLKKKRKERVSLCRKYRGGRKNKNVT